MTVRHTPGIPGLPRLATVLLSCVLLVAVGTYAGVVSGDRGDSDAQAARACASGVAIKGMSGLAVACEGAYQNALERGDFPEAMRHALLGCEKYQSPGLCRRVAGLPLVMGNRGLVVPSSFADDLRRVASAVCTSGKRYRTINGTDVTARECMHLARQFGLAHDDEYVMALEPEALRFFIVLYDEAYVAALHAAACKRLQSRLGCEMARSGLSVGVRAAPAP